LICDDRTLRCYALSDVKSSRQSRRLFSEFHEKHYFYNAVVLVDSELWLDAALSRQGVQFQYGRYGYRKAF